MCQERKHFLLWKSPKRVQRLLFKIHLNVTNPAPIGNIVENLFVVMSIAIKLKQTQVQMGKSALHFLEEYWYIYQSLISWLMFERRLLYSWETYRRSLSQGNWCTTAENRIKQAETYKSMAGGNFVCWGWNFTKSSIIFTSWFSIPSEWIIFTKGVDRQTFRQREWLSDMAGTREATLL